MRNFVFILALLALAVAHGLQQSPLDMKAIGKMSVGDQLQKILREFPLPSFSGLLSVCLPPYCRLPQPRWRTPGVGFVRDPIVGVRCPIAFLVPPSPTPDLPLYSSLTFPFLSPFPEPIPVDVVQGMHTAKFGPGGASADSAPAIAPAASHSPTSMTVTKDEEDKLQKMSIGDELNVRRRGGGGDAGTRTEEGI